MAQTPAPPSSAQRRQRRHHRGTDADADAGGDQKATASAADGRRLVRPTPHNPHASAAVVSLFPPDVAASVAVVVPPVDVDVEDDGDEGGVSGGAMSGRIDRPSGLAVLCLPRESSSRAAGAGVMPPRRGGAAAGGGGVIRVWEHTCHTLSEDLAPPPSSAPSSGRFVHPEYRPIPSTSQSQPGGSDEPAAPPPPPLTENLVALTPFGGGGGGAGGGGAGTSSSPSPSGSMRRGGGGYRHHHHLPHFSLYACSPNGVVCTWTDALGGSSSSVDPDASVSLPMMLLRGGETATFVAPGDPVCGAFVGTSAGRVWAVQCRSRPLELRGKVLVDDITQEADAAASASATGTSSRLSGMFHMLKEAVAPSTYDEEGDGDGDDPATPAGGGGGIVAILPLPERRVSAPTTTTTPTSSAPSTPGGGGRPSQRARIHRSPRRSILVVSRSLVVRQYLVHNPGQQGGGGGGGGMRATPRGRIDLLPVVRARLAREWGGGGGTGGGATSASSFRIEVLRCALARGGGGRTLVVAVRATRAAAPSSGAGAGAGGGGGVGGGGRTASGRMLGVLDDGEDVTETAEEAEAAGRGGPVRAGHRLYLLRCTMGGGGGRDDGMIAGPDDAMDVGDKVTGGGGGGMALSHVQWLNRYPSGLVPTLECVGLVAVEEEGGDGGGRGGGGGGGNGGGGGQIAYSTWQQQMPRRRLREPAPPPPPVTVTAVYFPPMEAGAAFAASASAAAAGGGCRTYDVELPRNRVPMAIGMGVTNASEGGLVMGVDPTAAGGDVAGAGGGCIVVGVRVRVEHAAAPASSSLTSAASAGRGGDVRDYDGDGEVETLTSHLCAAFVGGYYQEGGGGGGIGIGGHDGGPSSSYEDASVAASLPPSLWDADAGRLNAAAARSSGLLLGGDGGDDVDGAGVAVVGGAGAASSSMMTPRDALREKLHMHKSFVNFLSHAGIYRKLSWARCILADHGEMINASIALFDLLEEHSVAATTAGGAARARLLATHLAGLERDPTDVLSALSSLQGAIPPVGIDVASEDAASMAVVGDVSAALCVAFASALRWRDGQRDVLYDPPTRRATSSGDYIAPWTSAGGARELMSAQLRLLRKIGAAGESADIQVRTLADALLRSYPEDDGGDGGEGYRRDLVASYDVAKSIAIPLLRRHAGDGAALEASVTHRYFPGIVEICDEEKNPRGGPSAVSSAALRELVGPDGPLGGEVDSAGVTFAAFALSYLADRGRFADVLDLGRYCPVELRTFLDGDARMRKYRWMNDLREGRFADARGCLVSALSEGGTADGTSGRLNQSLEDRSLYLSIGKLAGKVAGAMDPRGKREQEMIGKGLALVRAQEMLGDGGREGVINGQGHTAAMSGEEIMELAIAHIRDDAMPPDDRIAAGLAGMLVAEILRTETTGRGRGSLEGAASVFLHSIIAESAVWEKMAFEYQRSALPDTEMKRKMRDTIFFGVVYDYHMEKSDGMGHGKGHLNANESATETDLSFFSNREVQNLVLKDLQNSQVKSLLQIAARVAVMGEGEDLEETERDMIVRMEE